MKSEGAWRAFGGQGRVKWRRRVEKKDGEEGWRFTRAAADDGRARFKCDEIKQTVDKLLDAAVEQPCSILARHRVDKTDRLSKEIDMSTCAHKHVST